MSQTIRVRNLRKDEADVLPAELLDTGMPFLAEEWVWVVEAEGHHGPFALVVTAFAHGWLVLLRLLAISPLPEGIPLNWFKEVHPQVFAAARARGCVGFLALLAEDRPEEAQMARIATKLAGGAVFPAKWLMCAGPLPELEEGGSR